MRVLIIGSTGKLGNALVERLKKDHHQIHTLAGRADLDITELVRLNAFVGSVRPSVIINASALVNMEACENDPVTAFQTNTIVPGQLAELAINNDALFFHFSTDYVLRHDGHESMKDGWRHGMTEDQKPAPWGIYGASKYAGELAVEAVGGNSIIMRLSSIYGDEPSGPTEVLAQVKRGRGTVENPVQVLRQFSAPTSARLIADAVAHVIATVPCGRWEEVSGIYHFATREGAWKKDFARLLLGDEVVIVEGQLTEPRPTLSFLNSDLFSATFKYDIPSTEEDWNLSKIGREI